ncbi:AcrR family transcriptional regulator [Paenibacillus phyllosphaerae]|uniref:AcrR family transcriptional regulator n=1 Tax=Paenibacillus phyllosphaerae TaxID=274593 RepID=A0A7W5AZZ1_9BACL|nr:TetR/AcrR family transcriptional regulator [Paenibacillus phyllosphaerae]MBB3111915.1 AcrR family transcriptional regulator [Paenibacillus phyllosphaerae]
MNGFEKRASMIKDKIMDTTLTMLKTWEPKRIRIADIAKEANVSQVTIYNYFGSKEMLLRETFKAFIDSSLTEFQVHMEERHTFKETIHYIMFNEKKSNRFFTLDLLRELLVEDREIAEYVDRRYNEVVIPLMAEWIERGKAAGEVSEKVTAPLVLAYFRMFMSQTAQLLELARLQGNEAHFAEELAHVFFYGICGKE